MAKRTIGKTFDNGHGYNYKWKNGKNIPEHHLVYCAFYGLTFIPRDKVIHHINGNKKDNRIENLKLMTRSEHIRLHNLINYPKGSLIGKNRRK